MNRLSLLNGNLPSNPKQNIKQAAYIQYLKSFAQTGLSTLQKLQTQFNKHYCRQNIHEDLQIFQKIRTLIASYEIFVLEINDSCQFIEVPEFGTCVLKVFIQLIGILNWSLQHLADQKKLESITTQAIMKATNSSSFPQLATTYDTLMATKSSNKRESQFMRNTFNGTSGPFPSKENKQNRCSQCMSKITQSPRDIYKMKEQATIKLKDLNEQISRITKEYNQQQKKVKKQQIQRNKLLKFIQKRQEAGKAMINIGLSDQSRNQQILTQILYTLNRKGQAISRFADMRITSLSQSTKLQQTSEQQYQQFKQQFSSQIQQKVITAKQKLSGLFKQHMIQYQRQRKQSMVDCGIQMEESESMKLYKLFHEKLIVKLRGDVRRLEKQVEYEKSVNEGMRKLLEEKAIEFEGEVIRYRNQLINLQFRSRKDLKSGKRLKTNTNNEDPFTSEFKTEEENSLLSIEINGHSKEKSPFSNYRQEESEESESEEIIGRSPGNMQNGAKRNFAELKKRLSKSKHGIKFHHIIERSYLLQMDSKVVNWCFEGVKKQITQEKAKFSKITAKDKAKTNTRQKEGENKRQAQAQTSEQLFKDYLSTLICISESHEPLQPKPFLSKTTKPSPSKRLHELSLSKKRSSHIQHASQLISPTKTPQTQTFSRLLGKSSKLMQRGITINSLQQEKWEKNDFMPILMDTDNNFHMGSSENCTYSKRGGLQKTIKKQRVKQRTQVQISSFLL